MNLGKNEKEVFQKVRESIETNSSGVSSPVTPRQIIREAEEIDKREMRALLRQGFDENKEAINEMRSTLDAALKAYEIEKKKYAKAYNSITNNGDGKTDYISSCKYLTMLYRLICLFVSLVYSFFIIEGHEAYDIDVILDSLIMLIPIILLCLTAVKRKGCFNVSDFAVSLTSLICIGILNDLLPPNREELIFRFDYYFSFLPLGVKVILFLAEMATAKLFSKSRRLHL